MPMFRRSTVCLFVCVPFCFCFVCLFFPVWPIFSSFNYIIPRATISLSNQRLKMGMMFEYRRSTRFLSERKLSLLNTKSFADELLSH